jgi:hypothetical protein
MARWKVLKISHCEGGHLTDRGNLRASTLKINLSCHLPVLATFFHQA